MSYLDGFRDACRLCIDKINASDTKEASVKEIRSLIRLAGKGEAEKLKAMTKK